MCGRYRLSRRKQLIAEYFETDNEVDWEPRYWPARYLVPVEELV